MKSLITYILMLVVFMGVSAHAGINHPNFSSETIFLECDGIKFYGKPRPTVYFYAIDNEKMIVRRIGTDKFEWSFDVKNSWANFYLRS
ncbi:MAG: hypothetical protein NZ730_00450 [Porticoccaceae bacterium]|nr:hypothetical protein [Porticoccaceae bacterium]